MQIVIFHYHLNVGGVTRIIESQVSGLRSLHAKLPIKVLCGACPNPEFYEAHNVELVVDERLNYLIDAERTAKEYADLNSDLIVFFQEHLNVGTVFHAHNLNLGKNPVLTVAVNTLVQKGYKVINHAHDFAEDRPVNMAYMRKVIGDVFQLAIDNVMYPKQDNYLFGVLNQADYKRLEDYKVDKDKIILLPNPVFVLDASFTAKDLAVNRQSIIDKFEIDRRKAIITYPVRVIRRKNIGELILLDSLFPNCQFLVTMPPKNPVELKYYKDWLKLCEEIDSSVIFEAGTKIDFPVLISGSDYCITTSIQEGFGMTYLEPWLMGTPVIGRDINYITVDLSGAGVKFPFLYTEINIKWEGKTTDFKELTYEEQESAIKRVVNEKSFADEIISLNPMFKNFPPKVDQDQVDQNKTTIEQNFSLNSYAKKLLSLYKALLKSN